MMIASSCEITDVYFLMSDLLPSGGTPLRGAAELHRVGLRPVVVDVSSIVGRPQRNRVLPPGAIRPRDDDELDELIRVAAEAGAVFVDYVVGLDEISFNTRKLFASLARHRADYIVVAAGELPTAQSWRKGSSPLRSAVMTARRALSPVRWAQRGARLAIRRRRAHGHAYALPWRVFSTHAERLDVFLERYRYPRERVLWVNSEDFAAYRGWLSEHGGRARYEPFAVFIDEAASSHPDFDALGVQCLRVDGARYSAAMRSFFGWFESLTGLRVVIAAHPAAAYDADPGFFGEREVLAGVTVDLVARASAVIAHSSTAVGFAVLFDKPLLCVDTLDMIKSTYALNVQRIATGLGVPTLTVDAPDSRRAFDRDPHKWPRDGFAGYRDKYLLSPEAAMETTWETVSGALVNRIGGAGA